MGCYAVTRLIPFQDSSFPSWNSQSQTLKWSVEMTTWDAWMCLVSWAMLAQGARVAYTAGRKSRDPARPDEVVVDTVEWTLLGLTKREWFRVIMLSFVVMIAWIGEEQAMQTMRLRSLHVPVRRRALLRERVSHHCYGAECVLFDD